MRRYRVRASGGEISKALFVVACVIAAMVVLESWLLMLIVGIVHLNWWHLVPTMGFNTALVLAALTSPLLGLFGLKGKS